MTRFFMIGCLCLYSTLLPAQKENRPVTSKIEKVTVFLQGAQVERTARQTLQPGKYNIIFNDVSPLIDKQSIQLKAEGKLTVLSVTHQLNHLKEQQVEGTIKDLEIQKEQLQEKISIESNLKSVYTQEEAMIIKNQSIKGERTTLKVAELKEAVDFQRARLTELYQKVLESTKTQKKLSAEMEKVDQQLKALHQKKNLSTSDIIVALDVKENTSAAFLLTYLINQSSWYPTYDIRVKDISQPLALQMKANLQQQSGEDWKEVKLVLSTGNPKEKGTKPDLQPWYLRYYIPANDLSRALSGKAAGIRVRGASSLEEVVVVGYGAAGNRDDNDEQYEQKLRKKENTAVNTTTVYQPTSTTFEVELPYTVPDDGKLYTVDINQFDLNATYEYYAAPKLDQNAYLTAKITDWQDLNLLPGEANLFFEGTFLGKSLLDLAKADDTLSLSLGRDKGVVVKRTLLKEFSSRKFLGSNKTDIRQYETIVRNNKQQAIKIVVEDQFPVSTSKEIEIDKLNYPAGKLEDDTKKVSWSVVLEPKKEQKLQFGYSVKYPKDRIVQLD
ncbi:MAG: mucoidy inhibitor MuiA family protein [Chitinophagaceae bacterium]